MTRKEKYFTIIFVLVTGVIVMGVAFTENAIKEGVQGFLIGTSIFAFIIANDMMRDL